MPKDTITIKMIAGQWKAEYQGPHKARIESMFGTNIIPTAFLPVTSPEDILSTIQGLNPDCDVKLERVA